MVKIQRAVFYGCVRLREFIVLDGVEEIGDAVCTDCTSLEIAQLPRSLKKLGRNLFRDCHNLKEIRYSGTMEEWKAVGNDQLGSNVRIVCVDGIVK